MAKKIRTGWYSELSEEYRERERRGLMFVFVGALILAPAIHIYFAFNPPTPGQRRIVQLIRGQTP